MIKPHLKDDALLNDIRQANRGGSSLNLWWLGQSGYLLQADGSRLLIDPYLSDSLTKKYAETDKPHVRMTERAVDPARLNFIDAVTSSHNHTDHLDAETLLPLMRVNAGLRVVVPEANRAFAADRLQCPPERLAGMDAGETADASGFRIRALPAAHETLETDADGRYTHLGYVIEAGGKAVYHSGDTVRYDGMLDWLRPWRIDAALLPINGRNPARRVAGNLSGAEAARLAQEMGAALVVPCHYEMFEFNTVPPDEFAGECERIGQPYRVLKCGERLSL